MTASDNNNLRVLVWDLGPKAPDAPVAPKLREAKTDTDRLMAESDFKAALAVYEAERDSFVARQREFERWHRINGGPFQIEMWSVNADEALMRDPERYALKLPKHMKPGRTQAEFLRQREEDRAGLDRARRADPQFGEKAA